LWQQSAAASRWSARCIIGLGALAGALLDRAGAPAMASAALAIIFFLGVRLAEFRYLLNKVGGLPGIDQAGLCYNH